MASLLARLTPDHKPDQMGSHKLPYNSSLESAMLGSLILSPEARASLLGPTSPRLTADHFFSEHNRTVFRKILQLHNEKSSIDLVLLVASLERDGELEKAGGATHVSALLDGIPEPTVTTALLYLQSLDNLSRTRQLKKLSCDLQAISGNGCVDFATASLIGEQILQTATNRDAPVDWRKTFMTTLDVKEHDPVKFLIRDFLPEGIIFIGGLSGTGKTWVSVAMVKALTTGRNFLGLPRFRVPEPVPVVYLIPEMGNRSFGYRLRLMGISGTNFYFHTRDNGPPLALNDPILLACARDIQPVFILDTAVRFIKADENKANEIAGELAKGCYSLLHAGARAIVANHHSPKSSAKEEFMTLENVLRGTGDFGAMADCVYGLRCTDSESLEITIQCVKARDFEAPKPFTIQGRPSINEESDFLVLSEPGKSKEQIEVDQVGAFIESNHYAIYQNISDACKVGVARVKTLAEKAGWVKDAGTWIRKN